MHTHTHTHTSLICTQVYVDYTVSVRTSDTADAAFDGDVYLALESEGGRRSVEMHLGKGDASGPFQVSM